MASLLNEKTLVLAILIQLLIASFSSLLVIGLASFFDPSMLDSYDAQKVKVGIVGEGELRHFLEKSKIRTFYYRDLPSAMADFTRNKIDAVLTIPPVDPEGEEIIQLALYLPKSDMKATLVTLQIKKPLEEFETYVRDIRSQRIGFEPIKLYLDELPRETSTYFEFIYGILIPLLVFTPVFISGGLIIDTLTEEYERKTMDLLLVSPAAFSEVMNGKMLTAILIAPFQAVVWLVLVLLNGIEVYHIGIILLLVGLMAAIFVIIGALVAVNFRERVVSQYLYSLLLILLFLIGYLFADSPFNLVTRLASGAAGAEALVFCAGYALAALLLYGYMKKNLLNQSY